ncbi:DNA repair protein RecO [Candidatus Peregrinibacteria bacterium CG10_big_fil_rev_8_21_14_0_10_36_19]|nr:MAG: DNA repair protein RecO [Candidatus Peregrinibacteria bacterium CG10_big_fil_rev_8_21_14_0_10_36_19]
MRNATVNCIILGHKNFGESDKLIFLYSEKTGKIKAIAKGSRKINSKFTGHLETLNFCTVELYFGPRNIIITEIISATSHFKHHENLEKLTAVLEVAKITNQLLFETQTVENLLSLIKKTIQSINATDKPNLISTSYTIKLLDLNGLMPDLKETQTSLPEKYKKFFHFLQTRPYKEIARIKIEPQENHYIQTTVENILQL